MATDNSFYNIKIFKLNRIKFEELYADAMDYIKQSYREAKQYFNSSSPFAQLMTVLLHLGRMIFYYIEDAIGSTNIKSSYRPEQIRGLATLTGHVPSRCISSRGSVKISYYNTGNQEYDGQVCYIPNKISINNKINGFSYIVLFSADRARITMTGSNFVEAGVVQGRLAYQTATGLGTPLQSFSFTERNYGEVDELFINLYVNNERWEIVSSLLDLGYDQHAAVVKTGMTGGVDVFFGNGNMGAMPAKGSTIMVEYIVSDGFAGNIPMETMNSDEYWEFTSDGYLVDGTTLDLNSYFKIRSTSDIIFGTDAENITLTQEIAPHASRSMVLANETNYKYFFKRMNMFSVIEVISGYNTFSDIQAQASWTTAYNAYELASKDYLNAVSLYGESSSQATELYEALQEKLDAVREAESRIADSELDDNTVYLMLVPDLKKRTSSGSNYFTCDEDLFLLSTDEQQGIIDLIESSGQRVITIENKIINPKTPRFAINAQVKLWENYNKEDVYNSCVDALSDYLISLNRRDIVPVSDIVALFEAVDGIDSVKVSFDPDKENSAIYGIDNYYGLDEYGDVMLTRTLNDTTGASYTVRDIYPMFRGDFTSVNGVNYVDDQQMDNLSGFNLKVTGYSSSSKLSVENAVALT